MTEQYTKSEQSDIYGGSIEVDKSVNVIVNITDKLDKLISDSKYSKNEVAERLGWSLQRLNMVLSGDGNITIYDITHITGCLGYDFSLVYKPNKE